jgi:hypothetical protein
MNGQITPESCANRAAPNGWRLSGERATLACPAALASVVPLQPMPLPKGAANSNSDESVHDFSRLTRIAVDHRWS